MPISLKKGQKVSLTKENPGLKNVVVGIGWDINAFDTGGDFDLDAAAFCLTDSGKVSDQKDFVFYGNHIHPVRFSIWEITLPEQAMEMMNR